MTKYILATALLIFVGSEHCLARTLNPAAKKAAPEKRMPAASGIAELPSVGVPLVRLMKDSNPEIETVISAYKKTERFRGHVQKNGKKQKMHLDFVLAGRFEPDAPVAHNLLIVKSDDGPKGGEGEPYVFLLGPIEISDVKMLGVNRFRVTGSGGNSLDGGEKCTFVGVSRTLTVEISLDTNGSDFVAKYVDTADEQWCSKK